MVNDRWLGLVRRRGLLSGFMQELAIVISVSARAGRTCQDVDTIGRTSGGFPRLDGGVEIVRLGGSPGSARGLLHAGSE